MEILVCGILALAGMVVVLPPGKIALEGDLWSGTICGATTSFYTTPEAKGLGIVCPRWLRKITYF